MERYKVEGVDEKTGKDETRYVFAASPEAAAKEVRAAGIMTSSVLPQTEDTRAASTYVSIPNVPPSRSDYMALSVFATAAVATGALVVMAGAFLILRAAANSDMNSALMGLGAVASGSLIAGAGECMGIARKFAIARLL